MSALLIVLVTLAAPPSGGASVPASTPAPGAAVEKPGSKSRTGSELREAVQEALRRWSRTTDQQADQAAREFLALHQELQRDTQLANASRQELRFQVRRRLLELSEQIAKRIAREKRQSGAGGPQSVAKPDAKGENLAQRGGTGRGAGRSGPAPAVGGIMIGPGLTGGVARFGTVEWAGDTGEALVDLIQKTIAPRSWDVNGGQGSIYYWRPGRAIAVRQREEVHEQVGETLRQIEQGGR